MNRGVTATQMTHGQVARPASLLQDIVLITVAERRCYGYELAQLLADWRVDNVSRFYRVLGRLETAGLVESEWELSAQGRGRRVYSMTPAGEDAVHECAESLTRLATTVERFAARYENLCRQ